MSYLDIARALAVAGSLRRRDEIKQRWKDLHELEQQAGIWEAARRAWDGPLFPRDASSDAPFGSDEWKRISELEDADEDRYTRRRIRSTYFSVAHIDLRKALINGEREIHSAYQNIVHETVVEANGELTAAKRRGTGHVSAAFSALRWVVLGGGSFGFVGRSLFGVAVGWDFGVAGAIAGAVVGYFIGHRIIDTTTKGRQEAIAQAEADLKDAKEGYEKALNKAPIFTRSEARTGEAEKAPANASSTT